MISAPPARASYVIRNAAQLRALRSPVRQEIVDAAAEAGPLTISELAALVGRKPHGFYYHVRLLQKVGLLRPAGRRRCGTSQAALYAVPARSMVIEYRLGSPSFRSHLARAARTMLRLAERDFIRGMRSRSAVGDGPKRNLRCSRVKARLTEAELAELSDMVNRLFQRLTRGRHRRSGTNHAVTIVMAPLEDAP